jgi:hypothetical protein
MTIEDPRNKRARKPLVPEHKDQSEYRFLENIRTPPVPVRFFEHKIFATNVTPASLLCSIKNTPLIRRLATICV